jgi:hypothetical protein
VLHQCKIDQFVLSKLYSSKYPSPKKSPSKKRDFLVGPLGPESLRDEPSITFEFLIKVQLGFVSDLILVISSGYFDKF